MRTEHLFAPTLRQVSGEVELASHRLLLRGGYIRQLVAGVYSLLPLGLRVLRRLDTIVREEMDAAGAQEVFLPTLHPIELWEKTGRAAYSGSRADADEGSQQSALCPRRHPRRGHHHAGRRRRAILSRASLHPLSNPDQVPR